MRLLPHAVRRFGGPIPSVNLTMVAYPDIPLPGREADATAIHVFPVFPMLQLDNTANAFFGGNFWDGRSTGYLLLSPDAEQAQHPPVDTQEMGLPDTACIAWRLSQSQYVAVFERVWGPSSLTGISWPSNTEQICSTPGGAATFGTNVTPVSLSPVDRNRANVIFDHWGQSLSAFEKSVDVSPFSSKFDAYMKGKYTMTTDELAGYDLFKGKGNCNSCHLDGRGTTLSPGQTDTSTAAQVNPLFTCFGYTNEGLRSIPGMPFTIRPRRTPWVHGQSRRIRISDLGMVRSSGAALGRLRARTRNGLRRRPCGTAVSSLLGAQRRHGAVTMPHDRGSGTLLPKRVLPQRYIKSLKQLVHFYNTATCTLPVTSGHCPAGTTEKVDCWPMPEVKNNLDMTVGKLGLTDLEENQIVAFLQTLTDGYTVLIPT